MKVRKSGRVCGGGMGVVLEVFGIGFNLSLQNRCNVHHCWLWRYYTRDGWRKVIASGLMYWGITLFAMPITIIGHHLSNTLKEANQKRNRKKRIQQRARAFIYLFIRQRTNFQLLKRAWNTWRDFTEDEIAAETKLPAMLKRKLAHFLCR
eukprot:c639_g1_i1.p1 GENE.c639_g1_i1~~c639_g1_i1.p1  ORF type:complete len:150 (-),score=24.74 c639_g1_i1:32-481(-)